MAADIIHIDHDLLIEEGDFVVGYADDQNLEDILLLVPGELKTSPLTGCGSAFVFKQRNGAELAAAAVKEQLQADGWQNVKYKHTADTVEVDAIRIE